MTRALLALLAALAVPVAFAANVLLLQWLFTGVSDGGAGWGALALLLAEMCAFGHVIDPADGGWDDDEVAP